MNLDNGQRTILVVEDDVNVLALLRLYFQHAGFQVLTARNATIALRLLEQHRPDLITTDLLMPGMNGHALCRELRTREDTRETPVLVISALGDVDSIQQALDAGANAYLQKPISRDYIMSTAQSLLHEVPV